MLLTFTDMAKTTDTVAVAVAPGASALAAALAFAQDSLPSSLLKSFDFPPIALGTIPVRYARRAVTTRERGPTDRGDKNDRAPTRSSR